MQLRNPFGNQQATARNEVLEFAKAWIGTALAFAVLYAGSLTSPLFPRLLLMAALTAGLGIVLHELAHRVVARYYGATAHFVANDTMLVLSVVLAFTGFLFAAPGAVWHSGYLTKRQGGLVAAAGPITNMVLAVIFAGLLLAARRAGVPPLIMLGLGMGFSINALLGAFNMLPLGPLDGAKVLNWSGPAFGVLLAIAAGIAFGLPRIVQGLPRVF